MNNEFDPSVVQDATRHHRYIGNTYNNNRT